VLGAAAIIVVALLSVGGLAISRNGPFAPSAALPTALLSSFGSASLYAGTPGGALTPTVTALPDGTVVETVALTQPASVDLGFGFCNSFVCGTSENLDCVGNLYIPGFTGALYLDFRFGVPPGSTVKDILISGGPTPDVETAYAYLTPGLQVISSSLLSGKAKVTADGVSLEFPVPYKAELLAHYKPVFKRICGFTEAELNAFRAKYGSRYVPLYPYITVIAHITRPSSSTGTQSVTVNGQDQNIRFAVPSGPTGPGVVTVYRQDDPRWSGKKAGATTYGDAGTVPAAIASLLSAFGGSADPPAVGKALIASGAWTPGKGSDWAHIATYLSGQKLDVADSDIGSAMGAGHDALFLAAYTDSQTNGQRVVVITGYDAARDRFAVMDPAIGLTDISWDDIAAGNPWVLRVSRKATT
jgi:hypothetical protein